MEQMSQVLDQISVKVTGAAEYREHNREKHNLKQTLIVGWNDESLALYDKIREMPALGYQVCGFISVADRKSLTQYRGVPRLGSLSILESSIVKLNIEVVLIAIAPSEQHHLKEIIDVCNKIGVTHNIISDVYDTVYGNTVKEVFKDVMTKKNFGPRRLFDFFGALLLMVLFLPVFVLTAIAIKLESRGSVFYSQLRTGKDNVPFRIFKFRSMVQNAEQISGPVWAQKRDPRITRVGNFMRKTRIDELPQLMNVLSGDMSFIGPRPERPFFVESFQQQIPLYANRHQIKPGVTGWAQVKWGYDETIDDVKEKLKYDLAYVNGRSLIMDIKIFFLTISTVVLGKGQ